jgi:hypothetical protein
MLFSSGCGRLEVSDLQGLVACSGCFMLLFYYLEPYAKVIT